MNIKRICCILFCSILLLSCGVEAQNPAPTTVPTSAPEPTSMPEATAIAESTAVVVPNPAQNIPPDATVTDSFVGPDAPIDFDKAALEADLEEEVRATFLPVSPEDAANGIGFEGLYIEYLGQNNRGPFWFVGTYGFLPPFDQSHFVELYQYQSDGWLRISHVDLTDVMYLNESSYSAVDLAPDSRWWQVDGGLGAHGGYFGVLRWDGELLTQAIEWTHHTPGAGWLEDFNNDGVLEVVLDQTNAYVFCYACGVREINYQVLRWEGEHFVTVELTTVSEDVPDPLRSTNNELVDLAQHGFWKEAQERLLELATSSYYDPAVQWNQILINLTASDRADQAGFGVYPLLDSLFYGDFAAAVDVMRPYSNEEIFGPQTPLIVGTVAEGGDPEPAATILTITNRALELKPDLAAAYFLRAWANYQMDPNDALVVSDLERAHNLAPDDELYSLAYAYFTNQ